jgi:hypothetical protein
MTPRDNLTDKIIILGNITVAGAAKAFSWHDFLTNAVLVLSAMLALLRVVDWMVKRYKYGWGRGDNTEVFTKDKNEN